MINSLLNSIKNTLIDIFNPFPLHLKNAQIKITQESLNKIKQSLENNYHTGWRNKDKYSEQDYLNDLSAHLTDRIEHDRKTIIPWLDNTKSLKGSRILEIGCGTGSSTVALAEQGAQVTGIDLDDGALKVAHDRCKEYGLNVDIMKLNANQILNRFSADKFDFIIFFACLEHMTMEERLTSLKLVWNMLPQSGYLVIIETPNRLWFQDEHTSKLPFFNWLPDDLAFKYSQFSPRFNFKELYRDHNPDLMIEFLRRGRGFSYHEIEIAIKPVKDLKIINSLSSFQGRLESIGKSNQYKRYISLLKNLLPNINTGFFDKNIDIIIEKN